MATNRVLVLLQENSGYLKIYKDIPEPVKSGLIIATDFIAEQFEDLIIGFKDVHYDELYKLTDTNCTREKLLTVLIDETIRGRIIDMVILGHGMTVSENGDPGYLSLNGSYKLTGDRIRTLTSDAQMESFNLRLVYMCNCWGSERNNDWLSIGAKVAIGPTGINYLPEPTTTNLLNYWVDKSNALDSANQAHLDAKSLCGFLLTPEQKDSSKLIVDGDGSIKIITTRGTFIAPPKNSIVCGVAPLKVQASGAHGVQFSAYYATSPNDINTVSWHNIALGNNTSPDEWSVNWDTSAIPDQGNAGWGTVNIAAGQLDENGTPIGGTCYTRVDVRNHIPVQIIQPVQNQLVHGITRLRVKAPGAEHMGFSAYYATNPNDISTVQWRLIGPSNKVCADEWELIWNTTLIPDQGNTGWGTVNLCAYVDRVYTSSLSPRTYCRVDVNNHVSVQFRSPLANSTQKDKVKIKVFAPYAPKVVFAAYYGREPLVRKSYRWYTLGMGQKIGTHTWQYIWDIKRIPDQGDSKLGTVNLCAVAFDATGHELPQRDFCRINIKNSMF